MGRNKPAIGPTKKTQIIVPMPKTPPRRKPENTKPASTIIRIMLNRILSLSLITIATRSLGPVPASELITMVIPKAKITHPTERMAILILIESKCS